MHAGSSSSMNLSSHPSVYQSHVFDPAVRA
jgi:hypothetical protein